VKQLPRTDAIQKRFRVTCLLNPQDADQGYRNLVGCVGRCVDVIPVEEKDDDMVVIEFALCRPRYFSWEELELEPEFEQQRVVSDADTEADQGKLNKAESRET